MANVAYNISDGLDSEDDSEDESEDEEPTSFKAAQAALRDLEKSERDVQERKSASEKQINLMEEVSNTLLLRDIRLTITPTSTLNRRPIQLQRRRPLLR